MIGGAGGLGGGGGGGTGNGGGAGPGPGFCDELAAGWTGGKALCFPFEVGGVGT